jgi:metal-dependent amidase/aminoacylase/carboxypeptidase family protein
MSWYLKKYPGVFGFLGIKNEEYGSGADLHNEFFDIDVSALKNGVAATVGYALKFLDEVRR